MNIKKSSALLFTLCFFVILIGVRPVLAGVPMDEVKKTTDEVLGVLRNKELKGPEKEELRRQKILEIVSKIFDFREMAKRSMGIYWRRRTPEERKEFVPLYKDLLNATYMRKVEKYTNEKIVYTDESIEGDYAVVRTRVITKTGTEIPLDYRLMKKDGRWVVYDVVIEGVSLVNNYRSQFSQIIRSDSYEELVKKLKKKTMKEPK
ncbi:MAG: ABC transporter substrate-binding protein [Candidatus Sulfobium sp.]|jgi:phospholipid transport system substrate-binding protein